jgi:RHS repeat-associated protein
MSITGSINGQSESAGYGYDLLGRLATSDQTTNGVSAQRRFDYDRWGNRVGVWNALSGGTQVQSVAIEQTVQAPGKPSVETNRISVLTKRVGLQTFNYNYSYDAAGNVTADETNTYQYDAENRLVSVNSGAAVYSYDYLNRRVKKVVGGATTHYIWDGSQVIAEYNGGTGTLIRNYIYSGARMLAKVEGGITSYYLKDKLSIRLSLSANGTVIGRQSHLPFGEEVASSGSIEKHQFTSYERDSETGLDYAINRGYSSGVGRFQSSDPYRASAKIGDPKSWNRYSYTRNNPVNTIEWTL